MGDLEGDAEDVMRLSLERLSVWGRAPEDGAQTTRHRPERKWMVVVDEERGRGHKDMEPKPRLFTNRNAG